MLQSGRVEVGAGEVPQRNACQLEIWGERLSGECDRSDVPPRPVEASPPEVGRRAIAALCDGRWPPCLYDVREMLQWAVDVNGSGPSPEAALALVLSHMEAAGTHSQQTLRRLGTEMALFVQRLRIEGVASLKDVTASVAQDFIDEAVSRPGAVKYWADPSESTRRLRRSALRLMFSTARVLNLCEHEPTLDIEVYYRTSVTTRPLTDEEIVELELAARQTLDATRLPAALAIAQAGGFASEVGAAVASDVDLAHQRVWLHSGGRRRRPRWGSLTDWGVKALERRIRHLGIDPNNDGALVYEGRRGGESLEASASAALGDVLGLAGLQGERGVSPRSIPAWAARREFERTGLIQTAMRVLGITSLDAAARVIGWDPTV